MTRKIQTGRPYCLFVLLMTLIISKAALAQTTAFTYQGKLTDAGNPANGNYDLQFKLFDALSGGAQQGATLARNPVTANAGVFTVTLDFGANVFSGVARYLEIGVRPAGSGSAYIVLAPRQPITASPYAIQTINAQQLGGMPASRYVASDANGKVGVGTAAPQATFHVNGSSWFQGDTTPLPAGAGKGVVIGFSGEQGYISAFDYGAFTPKNLLLNLSGGNVGIGTTNPQSKLTVQGGGYGLTHTNGVVTLGTFINSNAGWLGTRSNHQLNFFTNDSLPQMTLDTSGNVGIGTTTPATRLHVLNTIGGASAVYGESATGPGVYGKSVSSRGVFGESNSFIGVWGKSASNSGVFGETAVSSLTAAGVYGKGTGSGSIGVIGESNLDNAVGVFGVSTSPGGVGVYARNLSGGRAIVAEGNVAQDLSSNGLVKAMLYVDYNGGIARCYNGITNSSTGNCGFDITKPLVGVFRINFGFLVANRFVSVTCEYDRNGSLGLLALLGFTAYAYRVSEQWRNHSAAPARQPAAMLLPPRERYVAGPGAKLVAPNSSVAVNLSEAPPKAEDAELETALAPAQSGGSYNITQSVISGGGGASSNGNTNVTGALGQSVAATSSGGQYAVSGGFLGGAAAGASCGTLNINPAALPGGSAGASYSQSLTATGNTGAVSYTVSAGALPNGLQLSTGGLLSGAPTAFGAFNFSVRATDANGCESTRAYTLVICGPLALSPASLPGGVTGVAYSQTITAVSGIAPYSYSLSAGSLPGGLTLSAAGTLAGAPVSAGAFNFTITVTDSLNCQGARGYTLTINSGAVAALTTLSPGFTITGGGGVTLTVNGVNFTNGMIVRWNGANRATSFISSVELRAAIPAGDLTGNGRADITVFNPSTGATTPALSFLIVNQLANVSAASYAGASLAQESILAAFGAQLATTTEAATSVPLPTSPGGTSITVRDSVGAERQSPLFFVSPGQVNYQLPPGAALGAALIYLSSGDGLLAAQTAQIDSVAPALFTANSSGGGVPAALIYRLKADNTLTVEALASFDAAQNRFVAVPIDLGPAGDQVFLVLYGAGIRFRSALSAVSCTIGGVSASVEFAGKTEEFIGLDQINVRLPRSLAGRGEVDVVLTVDGKTANTVRVAFK